jgi:hypothetical protein
MKQLIIIGFCIVSFNTFSQSSYDSSKVSPLVRKTVSVIEAKSVLQKEGVVFIPEFKLLQNRAKDVELVQLVNHPNPTIRINAFDYLLTAAYPGFVDIIEQHLQDTTMGYLQTDGDIVSGMPVIEGMLYLISHNNKWIGMFPFSEADNKRLATLEEKYWSKKKNTD